MGKNNSKPNNEKPSSSALLPENVLNDPFLTNPFNDKVIQTDENQKNKNRKKECPKRLERYNSIANFKIIDKNNKIPHKCKIFENINIFNSILIMLNNEKEINNYFSKNKGIIKKCEEKNKNKCLSSILYYINKYMWDDEEKKEINEDKLYTDYKNYIDLFSEKVFANNPKDINCYKNIENLQNIQENIYKSINMELTSVNKKSTKKYNDVMHPILSNYKNSFVIDNNSEISKHFLGHFIYTSYCTNCVKSSNYISHHGYNPFYSLLFNLELVNKFYNPDNNNYNNTPTPTPTPTPKNKNFNIMDCFNYYFIEKDKNITSKVRCDLCKCFSKITKYFIYCLPNILTILFTKNNYNFELQDKLEFGKNKIYENNNLNIVKKYYLISMLYQYIDTKEFICYCLNQNNGLWYSYSSGKVSKVDKIDDNIIPLMAIYKIEGEDKQCIDIKKITKIDINNIYIKVYCTNGIRLELILNKKTNIKTLKEYISKKTKSVVELLLINSNKVEENKTLEDLKKESEKLIFTGII